MYNSNINSNKPSRNINRQFININNIGHPASYNQGSNRTVVNRGTAGSRRVEKTSSNIEQNFNTRLKNIILMNDTRALEEFLEKLPMSGKDFFKRPLILEGKLGMDSSTMPLHYAQVLGHLEIMHALILNGADINAKDKHGRTVLHYTMREYITLLEGLKETATLINYYLKKGADINAQDNQGRTALHYAAKSGNGVLIRFLALKGADRSIRDKQGCTPEQYYVPRKVKEQVQVPSQVVKERPPVQEQVENSCKKYPLEKDYVESMERAQVRSQVVKKLPPLEEQVANWCKKYPLEKDYVESMDIL